jgi:imidazolonepropionase-like amidohydrolase
LRQLLAAGAHVVIGTDSRGSNPDLSVMEELRFIARRFPDLDPATILRLGTWNAARALGVEAEVGSLEVGKRADFAVIELPHAAVPDPHRLLFESETRVASTFARGKSALA